MNQADRQPASPLHIASPAQLMLFVQSLRGAPASVLLALGFAGSFLSNQDLQLWTRCGHYQVTFALKSLQAHGWVRGRTSRGPWKLAEGRRLPVGFSFLEDASALKALSSGSDSLNTTDGKTLLPSARSEQLLDAMRSFGIREPTASELAGLPYMTLEYLQAHVQAAREHGLQIGAAIEAMRLEAPPPARPASPDRRAEVEDKLRRFIEGR